jgi:hypothetical protein
MGPSTAVMTDAALFRVVATLLLLSVAVVAMGLTVFALWETSVRAALHDGAVTIADCLVFQPLRWLSGTAAVHTIPSHAQ